MSRRPPTHDETPGFRRRLRDLLRTWQAGLALEAVLRLAGWFAAVLAGIGVLDFVLAFPERILGLLWVAGSAVLAGAAAVWLGRVLRLGEQEAARHADSLLDSHRQTILSALELDRYAEKAPGLPELQVYLCRQGVERAARDLGSIGFRRAFPFPELRARLRVTLIQAAVVALLVAVHPGASRVIAARLFTPWRDTPPCSPFVFTVIPDRPAVIYGGSVDIAVGIAGAPVKAQVWCLTRYRGQVHRAACFHENAGRYAQRIEKVIHPVDFCFTTGRARSRWHRVDLRLQPEITAVTATLTPPPYTGLPRRDIAVGRDELAGYHRTRVALRVVSNRPLSDGTLTLRPLDRREGESSVPGTVVAPNAVVFRWLLAGDADLECVIRDVRGTRNREPLRVLQKRIPDRPPSVTLAEPAPFSLATASSVITVAGDIDDDLGLSRADLVRTVVGYRDRSLPLSVAEAGRALRFSHAVDLKAVGPAPGQVLEFYVEAFDSNPAMTGLAASEVARVQIITEEEYAALLRARVSVEEFQERYRRSRAGVEQLVADLEALRKAVEARDDAAIAAALRTAKNTTRDALALLDRIAKDFPVYELEKSLAQVLSDLVQTLRNQSRRLDAVQAPYARLGATVDELIRELGGPSETLRALGAQADDAAAIGRVMEKAAAFQDIVRRQSTLVRRLERLLAESPSDHAVLGALGTRQGEIRDALNTWVLDLRARALALGDRAPDLRASAEHFADLVGSLDIPGLMGKASAAAANQDAAAALRHATLALERLRELLSTCAGTPFGGLCRQELGFSVPEALRATLQQMLDAAGRRGGGDKDGRDGLAGGGSSGGDANDGYWSGGFSPLNVPVLGPDRLFLSTPAGGAGAGSAGRGGRGSGNTVSDRERMNSGSPAAPAGRSDPLELVPEKYRDAVKRYFSTREERP